MPLNNHTILITGAGGGLGSCAALSLAEQGARIILLDKSIPKLEKTYDAIVEQNFPEPIMYPFDLAGANEQEYYELAARVADKFGSLEGLLHSAVEFTAFTPLSVQSTKDWGHTLNVNLNAAYLLTRVLLPLLEASNQASVVFTLDSHVLSAPAYAAAYGVSKIALQGLAQIWAAELEGGKKIRVNCLVPGPLDSPLRKKAFPAENKARQINMKELAPLYQYLFGSASIGITGQTLEAPKFIQIQNSCQKENV